jgi:hypothetical protein
MPTVGLRIITLETSIRFSSIGSSALDQPMAHSASEISERFLVVEVLALDELMVK